jgi:hypothetical protein
MRRTSGNKEVNRKEVIRAVEDLKMIAKGTRGTASNCASAHRDHNFWVGHRLIGLLKSQAHVLSHCTDNQQSIRMPRRRHELDAASAEIEYHSIQNIDVGLASVASTGADLPEFERASKDSVARPLRWRCVMVRWVVT